MRTTILTIIFVFLFSLSLSQLITLKYGDDDTVLIPAEDSEPSRVKRQLRHPASSIFAGFPGFDGKGFGGFHFPNFGNLGTQIPGHGIGGIHFQQPIRPKPKPVTGDRTCRTANSGAGGSCVQLRQCFPLLFSSSHDEEAYSGLAVTLRESAGSCSPSNSTYPLSYAIGGGPPTKDKNGICCAGGGSGNFVAKPRPLPPLQLPTTTKPSTSTWPSWPPAPSTTEAAEPYNCAGFYVIGGTTVAGRPYPWMVSIKDGRTNRHVCGGSLISPRSVLSAAHCVQSLDGQRVANIRVYLGTNDITRTGRCTVVRKVKNIKYHRGFSMKTLHHDIAILTLASPVRLNNNIQTVPLGAARVRAGTKVTVAGWGGVYFGSSTVGKLRHVSFNVINNRVCAAKYVGHAPAGITQHQLCAGSSGRDSCVGDSGGPLMQNGAQIGVVSFGVNCGVKPGVYTRVSSYMSWINKNKS